MPFFIWHGTIGSRKLGVDAVVEILKEEEKKKQSAWKDLAKLEKFEFLMREPEVDMLERMRSSRGGGQKAKTSRTNAADIARKETASNSSKKKVRSKLVVESADAKNEKLMLIFRLAQ